MVLRRRPFTAGALCASLEIDSPHLLEVTISCHLQNYCRRARFEDEIFVLSFELRSALLYIYIVLDARPTVGPNICRRLQIVRRE